MDDLWRVLIQFVFRLSFGVAVAMLLTSSRQVNSGFFRVHLWVLMGLNTFGALALYSQRVPLARVGLPGDWLLAAAISAAVLSYAGAVIWLYEGRRWGKRALALVALIALGAALGMHAGEPVPATASAAPSVSASAPSGWLIGSDVITSGLLLGLATAAMLLGHWYLNSPGMKLEPLRRLIVLLGLVLLLRAGVSGVGLVCELGSDSARHSLLLFAAFRWLAGILGTALMAWMAWQTLKIPNTQSATGILYAAVIVAFLGELTSQLLSASSHFPL